MAQIPEWLNRDNVQMVLIVMITIGIHYYFISQRLQANVDEAIAEMEADKVAAAAASQSA